MVVSLIVFLGFVGLVFYLISSIIFCCVSSRTTYFFESLNFILKGLFSSSSILNSIFTVLIIFLLISNVLGNLPIFASSSIYYFFTVFISLTFWVALIMSVFFTQFNSFVSHMLPYGSPSVLILFLPVIEIFSHLIRPFTLMIRLSTNLSSGHIMMFIFSFFSVSSFMMTLTLTLVLMALFILELAISALQAYIFSSLSFMYVSETL